MAQPRDRHVLIVGAGLAGSLLACFLARMGYRVSVYERRPDPREAGYVGGRSINLALSVRGITALERVGLAGAVLRDAIPMRGRMMHPVDGELTFQPYSADPGDAINSVSRGGLNVTLLDGADGYDRVSLAFERRCLAVEPDVPAATFRDERTGEVERIEPDVIIGADGAYSAVRLSMQMTDRFEYSQSYLEHGYKELRIPPAAECGVDPGEHDGFAMDPHALHIWPRGGAMMIALPNKDRSFTCTIFWPYRGEGGFESVRSGADARVFFEEHYPDAVPLMPALKEDFERNPVGSLVTVRCFPWQIGGKAAILGDAAHAIVPFFGQGMNAAFEDCRVLAEVLERHGGDFGSALPEFELLRKENADAIADMALENFVEMRDRVADPEFLYAKRIEQALHAAEPERFLPKYNTVSFTNLPYVEALGRGKRLDAVIGHVASRLPRARAQGMEEQRWRSGVVELAREAERSAAGGEGVVPVHDVTPRVSERLKVWPGDTPLSREVLLDMARGDNITLSTLRATVHLGAHADGPNHYGKDAPAIDRRALDYYLGPCVVVDASVDRGARVGPGEIRGGLEAVTEPRVLVRTGTYPDPEQFNEDFAGLSVELIDALAGRGVRTVGVDTPSVDLFDSKDLPAHRAVLKHDMAILEGLVLRDVPPGRYELIALPLALEGFDASPVRAVLRLLG